MGIGGGIYVYDVVVKSSRSLPHLALAEICTFPGLIVVYWITKCIKFMMLFSKSFSHKTIQLIESYVLNYYRSIPWSSIKHHTQMLYT